MERNSDVGRFARLCWEDHTSGCAGWYASAVQWRDHFQLRHPNKVDVIIPLLKAAYTEYFNVNLRQPDSVEA